MGYEQPRLAPAEIMEEIAAVTPTYGGVSHARLDSRELGGRGLQWPCPNASHPGTPILHAREFSRGVGAFSTPSYRPSRSFPMRTTHSCSRPGASCTSTTPAP